MFGFLALVFLLLIATCALSTIWLCHIQLCRKVVLSAANNINYAV